MLIAEIGMCHNGSVRTAKQMIAVAKACGADLVKGQAFKSKDVKGSMPQKFYDDRELNIFQLTELIEYGKELGMPVFFSIFSEEFDILRKMQRYHKFSASQSRNNPRWVEENDAENVIASVNPMTMLPNLKKSHVLYACPYLTGDPRLEQIQFFTEYYGRQVGYSDHTIGVDWCIRAKRIHGARVIEKHFTLTRDIYFEGNQFRDAIHGATPKELEHLAGRIK